MAENNLRSFPCHVLLALAAARFSLTSLLLVPSAGRAAGITPQ
jgi:hypothetical protein